MNKKMENIEKKFLNDSKSCVNEALKGFVSCHSNLTLIEECRSVILNEHVNNKVGIVSGGGSGHEPFCAGYVGNGMLAAAVCGSIFASPPVYNILQTIRLVSYFFQGGVYVVVPNYTGDCLNFGLAIEQAKTEGIKVDYIIFGDDCACLPDNFQTPSFRLTGRRGMCGMILLQKIIGGMSEKGGNLDEIAREALVIQQQIATMGVALYACSLPDQPKMFKLAEDEVEFGIGVHGEAGIKKDKISSAENMVREVLRKIFNSLKINADDSVIVLVNNLGSTTKLEELIVVDEVQRQLREKVFVQRIYSGAFMTSLNMSGIQITILQLTKQNIDWLKHLDSFTSAPAWPNSVENADRNIIRDAYEKMLRATKRNMKNLVTLNERDKEIFEQSLIGVGEALLANKQTLNELDSGCGDGDCGTTLAKLAKEITRNSAFDWYHPQFVFERLATVAETEMGGTSGALYSLFFNAGLKFLEHNEGVVKAQDWTELIRSGVHGISRYSQASYGDRTMLDVLIPVCEELKSLQGLKKLQIDDYKQIMQRAEKECENTKFLTARAGRASYVQSSMVNSVDAGAFAVNLIIQTTINVIVKNLCD